MALVYSFNITPMVPSSISIICIPVNNITGVYSTIRVDILPVVKTACQTGLCTGIFFYESDVCTIRIEIVIVCNSAISIMVEYIVVWAFTL